MKKYNLLINNSFKEFGFSDKIDDSIFAKCKENLLQFSVILTLETKPDNNTEFIDLVEGDNISCYIFPLSNKNSMFNVGDLLYTHDNNAIFIIESHVIENQFQLTLVDIIDGSSNYSLLNTTPAILHNIHYERFMYENNELAEHVRLQKNEYTKFINSNNDFVTYFLEKITISDDSTINVAFDFAVDDTNKLFANIIDKFHWNVQIFGYNDFKYVYSSDIKSGESIGNEQLSSSDRLIGVLKSLQTKIIPHYSQQLIKDNQYSYSTAIINEHTKFSKTYDNDKLIMVFQLSLKDKSTVYDQDDNVESDYMYLIW